VRALPAARRGELRARTAELLLLWAHALANEASAAGAARRTELLRGAGERNARAEEFFGTDSAPRALWAQRAALARLSGDEAGADRARRRARVTPIRSPRDYALSLLDAPADPVAADLVPALAGAAGSSPRDFALWMALGQCDLLRGRLAEAEDCFSHAASLRPGSPWPYYHRARVAIDRRAFQQARDDCDEAIRLRPDVAATYVHRALARMGLGDAPGTVRDLSAALERGVPQTRVYFIRAEARARAGDAEGAERDRAEGLRRTPDDAESWVARGLARLPGDPAGARADIDEALRLDPTSRRALRDRAVVLSEYLGRTDEAIATLDRAVTVYPEDVAARVGRGVLLARSGRREAAHRDAEEARRRDGSGDTVYRIACIYALTSKSAPGDRRHALGALRKAIDQDRHWAEVARTDPDLDALRSGSEFGGLIQASGAGGGSAEAGGAPRDNTLNPNHGRKL
jgi:tetratricopeptide (TPR) repeat protein